MLWDASSTRSCCPSSSSSCCCCCCLVLIFSVSFLGGNQLSESQPSLCCGHAREIPSLIICQIKQLLLLCQPLEPLPSASAAVSSLGAGSEEVCLFIFNGTQGLAHAQCALPRCLRPPPVAIISIVFQATVLFLNPAITLPSNIICTWWVKKLRLQEVCLVEHPGAGCAEWGLRVACFAPGPVRFPLLPRPSSLLLTTWDPCLVSRNFIHNSCKYLKTNLSFSTWIADWERVLWSRQTRQPGFNSLCLSQVA